MNSASLFELRVHRPMGKIHMELRNNHTVIALMFDGDIIIWNGSEGVKAELLLWIGELSRVLLSRCDAAV